ncbi:hypothetical protein [Cellulomonas xiejunii]|uniref:Uncharacterized protein n=1 Tax=Cellulomonas xiejunii TaxID=2968083 RepID=A0ABY5KLJ4_9CELL|nr:hypothetical protein [Cellulomonas xiejunii]MCC2315876.1 hypothetical protein [Cellulomonas xiejunii]MCC2320893.1 hypothetical protein [Cellulomonas xiejunii]UUI71174.1 hypothetical protein NP048_15460 [Cellulomonas xiejunii]
MEILPGVGVDGVSIGDAREDVAVRLGPPVHEGDGHRDVYATTPALVVDYSDDDRVEIVQVAYGGQGDGNEVFFDGVQLTYRFLDEVVADLLARGYEYTPSDIGVDFRVGFALFSMGSLDPALLDPQAGDDERLVVEGVSVAPYEYLVG